MKKVNKKIWLTILGILLLISVGGIFYYPTFYYPTFYKNNIYETPEDWDNIKWKKYVYVPTGKLEFNIEPSRQQIPSFKIEIPESWETDRYHFKGWTNHYRGYVFCPVGQTIPMSACPNKFVYYVESFINMFITDDEGWSTLFPDRDEAIVNINIESSPCMNDDCRKNYQNDSNCTVKQNGELFMCKDSKEDFLNNKKIITHGMMISGGSIITRQHRLDYIFFYKTNSNPAKVYDAFSHIVNSFEIIE